MEGGLSSIQVLDLRSMHMGGSLHMRGGAPGGHSAIFMEDTKKRKAAGGGDQRSVDEILQGAMLREKRRKVGGWESLSLSELKVKLKELGVEQRKIAACFERSQRLCHALAPCPPLSIACVLFSIHAQTHQSVNYLVVSSAQPAMFIARCALLLGRRQQQQQEGFGTEEEESGHPAFLRQHFEQGEAIFWQGMLKAIVDLPQLRSFSVERSILLGGGRIPATPVVMVMAMVMVLPTKERTRGGCLIAQRVKNVREKRFKKHGICALLPSLCRLGFWTASSRRTREW